MLLIGNTPTTVTPAHMGSPRPEPEQVRGKGEVQIVCGPSAEKASPTEPTDWKVGRGVEVVSGPE